MGWETNERKIKLATGTYQVRERERSSKPRHLYIVTGYFKVRCKIIVSLHLSSLYDQTSRHRNRSSGYCLLSSLCLPSDLSIGDVMCIIIQSSSIVLISNSLSCTDLARPGIRAVTNGEMLTFKLCILHPITWPDGQNNNITQYINMQ